MADEETLAVTPGEDTTPAAVPDTPVTDGIVDIDAQQEAPPSDDDNPDAKPKEAEAEGDKDEKDEADDKPKKPSGAQRAKAREARLLSELRAREAELESYRSRQTNAGEKDAKDQPPKEEDFNGDFFAFQRAQTAYEVRQVIREENSKVESSKQASRQQEIARERAVAHAERIEDAREVIADFDQVMNTMKGVNVQNEVIDEIMQSDQSALLAYHLAKNPDKLHAMNSMSARELAREMGRLEATVRLPSPKKQTTAPPPLSAIKGGTSPSSPERDLEAWLKKTYGR